MTAMPFSTKLENIQVNKSGFRYYSELPKNYRLSTSPTSSGKAEGRSEWHF